MSYSLSYSSVIFLLLRKSLDLYCPQIRACRAKNFLYNPWNIAEWIHILFIFFFSSTETGNLALGVPFSHCWQRSTAGWHLSSATAELKYSLPSSKMCFKQTNKTRKKPSKYSPTAVRTRSEFERIWLIFSATPPSQKFPSIPRELSSAQISWNCNVKNVRQQFWSNCGL